MAGQSRKEGWLMIDNRCAGLGIFESATYTCSHCDRIIMKHADRTRERGFCRKCDSYICDKCEAVRVATGGECKTFKQIGEEIMRGK